MAYTDTLLANEQDDVLMMNPDPAEAAKFDNEGSGATSGYGDLTEDDLGDDDALDDSLDADVDDPADDDLVNDSEDDL